MNYAKLTIPAIKILSKLIHVKNAPLIEGENSILRIVNYCKLNGFNKALIVTAPFLTANNKLNHLFDKLRSANIEFCVFDKIETEPTFNLCEEVRHTAKEENVDLIVAVGGGSVLDLCKVVCAGVVDDKPLTKFAGILKIKKQPLPLFAVPTTAGTGSETTFIAVITDSLGQKRTVISPKIVPTLAVLDSNLLVNMPAKLTASTGIDALSHAIESYVSTQTTDGHDFYAPTAVSLIFKNLKKCVDEPENKVARQKMLKASYLAGVSMNKEMVGYAHAFAHQLGSFYHIPHGEAIAMVLVKVLRFERENCQSKLAQLGVAIGLDESLGEELLSKLFVEKVANLIREIGLQQYCKQVEKKDYEQIVNNAFKETAFRYPVCKFMSKEDAFKFLDRLDEEEINLWDW